MGTYRIYSRGEKGPDPFFCRVSEFFAMGGYALYVWGSYGVTFVLLILEIIVLRKRSREAKA